MSNKIWGEVCNNLPPDFQVVRNQVYQYLQKPPTFLKPGFNLLESQKKSIATCVALRYSMLFDDMGLGKTLQAICIDVLQKCQKTLIICPNNIKQNWVNEIAKFTVTPISHIYVGGGSELTTLPPMILSRFKFFIFNYESLMVANKTLNFRPALFDHVDHIVCDEVHRWRNSRTQSYLAFRHFFQARPPKFLTLLSGTPVDRYIGELWPYLALIDENPWTQGKPFLKFFPHQERFDEHYAEQFNTSVKKGQIVPQFRGYKAERLPQIKKLLGHRIIQRKIEDVKELPPLTVSDHHIKCVALDIEDYTSRVGRVLASSQGQKNPMKLLEMLAKGQDDDNGMIGALQTLRLELAWDKVAGTVNLFNTIIQDLKKPIIIFSEFVTILDKLDEHLKQQGYISLRVQGTGMKLHERDDSIENFKKGKAHVLLATYGAMSEGVNLQHANVILSNDIPWQPTVLQQAQRRIWRIGQTQPCYHHLVKNPCDQWIQNILDAKNELIVQLDRFYKELKQENGL